MAGRREQEKTGLMDCTDKNRNDRKRPEKPEESCKYIKNNWQGIRRRIKKKGR